MLQKNKPGATYHIELVHKERWERVSANLTKAEDFLPSTLQVDRVKTSIDRTAGSDEEQYVIWRAVDADDIPSLSAAEVMVQDGVPFAVPVFDVQLLDCVAMNELKRFLLRELEHGIRIFCEAHGGDLCCLEEAVSEVKSLPLYIECDIGPWIAAPSSADGSVEPGSSCGVSARLSVRWVPDEVTMVVQLRNPTGTQHPEEGVCKSFPLTVYWRSLSPQLIADPGMIEWIDETRLRYISYVDKLCLVLDIDKPPADFSYYHEPPRRRALNFAQIFRETRVGGKRGFAVNF